MPEIGEVARIVHYLRKHLLHRTIKSCQAFEDDIVYGKVGCSAAAFEKAVAGRRVTGAAQQGKYFYVTFDKPPHAVMHFGMTGWMKFSCEDTAYYKQAKEKAAEEEWPPKYMKFLLRCDAETVDGEDKPEVSVAFVDARRLARIRLVDCETDKIRDQTPLKENGPDPVRDKDILTVDWLRQLLRRKRVPVKALLLDQANISGVGNWVADEILYQARIHPEQYCNTFSDSQIEELHKALTGVCTTAVETLADSKMFPETWLMKYRWDKGKKDGNILPNGEKIVHLTVGGRTSAVVLSRQKKTGAVAGDVDSAEAANGGVHNKSGKRKAKDEEAEEDEKPASKKRGRAGKKAEMNGTRENGDDAKQVDGGAEVDEEDTPAKAARKKKGTPKKTEEEEKVPTPGSRRSTRTRNK